MRHIISKYTLGASLLAMSMTLSSCNDWLDVRPDTEQKEEDQFSTEKGFQTALTGCYMQMSSQDIYGLRLTMTNIESLADLWQLQNSTTRYEDEALEKHDYTSDYGKSAMSTIYSGLFNTITQANLIIKNADTHQDAFKSTRMHDIIQGEAYAIRAYCQFDVLRLFGQMPNNAVKQVSLPYSEATTIDEIPSYYSYQEYVAKLKSDLAKAESLLKDNDPVQKYSFTHMDYTSSSYESDEFLIYRQMRLNYWAVRGLHARLCLYVGDTTDANAIAKEIIGATNEEGTPVRELSGLSDFSAGYTVCPNECLFSLSKYDILDYVTSHIPSTESKARYMGSTMALSKERFAKLYEGENIDSHNRYSGVWNQKLADNTGALYVGLKKYYFSSDVENKDLYYAVIPMIRMSEIYLIAMETGTDITDVNSLYKTYMVSHNVTTATDFASLDEAKTWIENEYRREFFGEGQMFFTYKRLGEKSILWDASATADENTYIIPLPTTEYNPAGK